MATDWPYRKEDRDVVVALTCLFGADPPPQGVKHFYTDLGDFRLVWERHTEFTRYTFIAPIDGADPFGNAAIKKVPPDWIENLPGKLMAAVNASMVERIPEGEDWNAVADAYFDGNALIGSRLTGASGVAITDFHIHDDDFSRILIINKSMGEWHAGRIVQRLLEIEVYRVMALLALPVAQGQSPGLKDAERELVAITTAMSEGKRTDDQQTLDSLMRLQASVERGVTESQYRFSAAAAYDAIVSARIKELREGRIEGMQTFQEFVDRRLAPALNTCKSVSIRQRELSERVKRASQLLLTQADISLARQNQAVLESVDRRAALQLRLQRTVEGLSVAAISYYIVGLVAYVAKGLLDKDAVVKPEMIIALSVPLVLLIVGLGLIRTRRIVEEEDVKTEQGAGREKAA